MDIVQRIITKVRALPLEGQQEVLALAEELAAKEGHGARFTSYGSCADMRTDLSFEEFAQSRRELWGNSTDTEMER